MTEPTTPAGRGLSENRDNHAETCHVQDRSPGPCECTCDLDGNIRAIERQAVSAWLASEEGREAVARALNELENSWGPAVGTPEYAVALCDALLAERKVKP